MQRSKLMFIHGFIGHHSDWRDVRDAIERVSPVETGVFAIKPAVDWSEHVERLASELPRHSILIGYSMGARLALGIALAFPEKLGGLVLISGNPGLESESARSRRWAADQKLADEIERLNDPADIELFLQRWYQQEVFATTSSEVRNAAIGRRLLRPLDAWGSILRVNSVARQPNYWPKLSELAMPVRVVAGQADEKYRSIAVRFAQENSAAIANVIPKCGHMVPWEQQPALVSLVKELVEQVRR